MDRVARVAGFTGDLNIFAVSTVELEFEIRIADTGRVDGVLAGAGRLLPILAQEQRRTRRACRFAAGGAGRSARRLLGKRGRHH